MIVLVRTDDSGVFGLPIENEGSEIISVFIDGDEVGSCDYRLVKNDTAVLIERYVHKNSVVTAEIK